jgi:death on curing protein
MSNFRWITKEMALAIHARQMAEHGGQEGIREESLLESALARPQMKADYESPDLCTLAASYAHGISKNHPFLDGNKRTAFVVYRLFLSLNGIKIHATREDRYFQMLSLAAGEHSEESFAAWLRTVTTST